MLVLTRKKHQKILIGDSIAITIVAIERDHVRIGISAPREVKVYRQELFEEIQAANRAAAVQEKPDLSSLREALPAAETSAPTVDRSPRAGEEHAPEAGKAAADGEPEPGAEGAGGRDLAARSKGGG
jgi:carbon storage regulator